MRSDTQKPDKASTPTVTYLRSDIDCLLCLADARQALISLPGVERVEEHSSKGCLVVTHGTEPAMLTRVVAEVGHRFVIADNGEIGMGQATVISLTACRMGHHRASAPHDLDR